MKTQGILWRRVIGPILALLRKGATPQRLAWSLSVGVMIGINPLLGSTTVLALLCAWLFRLNIPASQIGTHGAYPLQLLLLLPFLHVGSVAFHTAEVPLSAHEITSLAKAHPWDLIKLLWTWEWHALIIWAALALIVTPVMAFLLTRVLTRAIPSTHHLQVD